MPDTSYCIDCGNADSRCTCEDEQPKRKNKKSLYGKEIEDAIKEDIIEKIKQESSGALVGREQIAKYFDPTMTKSRIHYFFKKHGKELRESHITYKFRCGNPPQIYTCAFPEHLRQWAMKKAKNNEIL